MRWWVLVRWVWRVLVWRVLVRWVWRVWVGRELVGHEGRRWVGHGRVVPEVRRDHVCRRDMGHVGWGSHVGHLGGQKW